MCFLMILNCIFVLSELVLSVSVNYPPWGEWRTLRQDRSFSLSFEEDVSSKIQPFDSMFMRSRLRGSSRHGMRMCSSIWSTYGARQRCSPDCWSSPWSFWIGGRRRRQGVRWSRGKCGTNQWRDQYSNFHSVNKPKQERSLTRSTTTSRVNHNRSNSKSRPQINAQDIGKPPEMNWTRSKTLKPKDVHRVQELYNQIEKILWGVPWIDNNK